MEGAGEHGEARACRCVTCLHRESINSICVFSIFVGHLARAAAVFVSLPRQCQYAFPVQPLIDRKVVNWVASIAGVGGLDDGAGRELQ